MKKLIAIAAVLTIFSGAAFAQPLFKWSASAAGLLSVEGFSEKEAYTDAYGREHQGRLGSGGEYSMPWLYVGGLYNQERRIFNLGATVANEAETLGAWLSVETSIPHQSGVNFSGLGYVWWQPLDKFKAQIGLSSQTEGDPFPLYLVDDGFVPVRMYGSAISSVSGGYHSWWNPQRVHHGYGRESVMAATFEFFPTKNLYVTSSTPFEPQWNGARGGAASIYEINALDVLAQTAVQVSYSFPGAGIAALTWDGGTMQVDQYPLMDTSWLPGNGGGLFFDDPAFVTAGFTLTRFYDEKKEDGFLFYIGLDVPLPSTRWRSMYVTTTPATESTPAVKEWRDGSENYDRITVQRPYGVGIRAYFKGGGFQVVGGLAANFLGYTAFRPEGELLGRVDMPLTAGATLNPQLDLRLFNVGLVAEFKYHAKQKNIADAFYMFNVGPYIQKRIGNGALWAAAVVEGIALDNSDKLNPNAVKPWKQGLHWYVPIGLRYSH